MQQLRVLARRKALLAALVIFAVGGLILAGTWIGFERTPTAPAAAAEDPLAVADAPDELGEDLQGEPTAAGPPEMVIVYVSGAVRAADVYQLPAEARVKDLVLAAGGLAPDADPERVNLAQRIKDGEHIHIPRQGEAMAGSEADGAASTADGSETPGGLIDINTAGAAELDGLPGIGQALAQRIVEYRTANGPFKAIEDLRSVKGIGPALFANIAPLITAGP
jgi:competence protein ComEA